jgi:hypothetical protein
MKRITFYIAALALMALASCKQDELQLFNSINRLQFGCIPVYIYSSSYCTLDTTKAYTFFYAAPTVMQDTVFFDIYTSGNVSTKDRSFTLQQVQVSGITNAIAGTDYKAFTDPTVKSAYVIKAGQVHASVPIVLLRNSSQKTATLTLKLMITANENFQLGQENCLWRKIVFTDRVSKPASWSDKYFGIYSVTKHSFMIQTTGQKWDQDFCLNLPYVQSKLWYYQGVLKAALSDYNKAHPNDPLRDENNLLVEFP